MATIALGTAATGLPAPNTKPDILSHNPPSPHPHGLQTTPPHLAALLSD